jgi:ABC-type multidrug transport system fused ATPase/permease subunit
VTDTAHKNCANVQSLPVQVLPSSYLGLGGASDVNEFFSLLPLLDDDTRVIIPAGYLRHAEDSLMMVSRVLQGLAMFADGFKLEVSADREKAMRGPFVSFEVLPENANSLVDAQLDKLVVRDKKRNTVFDSKGLGGLAVVQVIDGQGVLVSRVGSDALNLQVPLEFSNGNLVVLDNQGVKLTLNTNDPQDEFDLNESGRGLFFLIERYHVPFVIAVIVLLIALTLLVIRSVLKERYRRLARRRDDQHGKP